MSNNRVRVVGSGFTTFSYRGQPIAFMDSFNDGGQSPSGRGVEGVTPIGARHPIEIVTGRVLGVGTITARIRELWNEPVWYQLSGLRGVGESITDIWENLANDPSQVTCQRLIKPPKSSVWRGTDYFNVVITDIDDSDNVTSDALSVPRNITMAYTHKKTFTTPAGRG